MVDVDVAQRARRHARRFRIGRVLHDRDAAAALDRLQAGGAVVEEAGEEHADHAPPPCERRRAEQRIDRRTRVVLLGSAHDAGHAVGHEHVVVGRRDEDPSGLERLAVECVRRAKPAGAFEKLGQDAAMTADVQHDEHRRGEIRTELRDEDR